MTPTWRSAWHGQDIVIHRDADERVRLNAARIERLVCAQSPDSDCAVDLRFVLAFLNDEAWLLPAFTGIAGPVHFERQAWWAQRACMWWVDPTAARLPAALTARLRPWERPVARVARLTLPHSYIRLSAGRRDMPEAVQALCFMAGANSIFYGDKLLTTGNPEVDRDRALMSKLDLLPL